MSAYDIVSAGLSAWKGSIGSFVRDLDRRSIRYLAFSQVSSLEFCRYRYFLEYFKKIRPRPEPDYFVKGNIFHRTVARFYRGQARKRPVSLDVLHRSVDRHRRGDGHELKNAVTLSVQNAHVGWEIVGVEKAFVLSLGKDLPPCLGVIDLILRQGSQYAVVDHKTGKNFNAPDALQITLYRELVRQKHEAECCTAFFDEYRWVNNLTRIRKPAFQRTEVSDSPSAWDDAKDRITKCHREMMSIEQRGDADGGGPCYMCPYQNQCPKASRGYSRY